ncbi:M20 family metallopeptidase [Bacillus sp. JJ1532]|uniref:M20 family metallopeptidase n=1 Tax=Bacillus sp. JJ1532 TaxID=3122958 RepID=UPI002FFDBFD8
MKNEIFRILESDYPLMVQIRRDFHMHPELSFKEVRTPNKIAEFHKELGLEVKTGVGGRGVVSTLRGGKPGKTVALRADFDALPIQDEKQVEYKSKVEGVMHACGHDAHTASLLVLAKALTSVKEEIAGNIVFIHQHAEEVLPGGAIAMIEDGCLENVDAIFGTHVRSTIPYGKIGYRSGYMMAAPDKFSINVIGKGGHGAYPHETVDAIVLGSQIVANLQNIVSRKLNPLDTAVVTVGSFHAGNAFNVISDRAVIEGTIRTFDETVRTKIEEEIGNIAKGICMSAGGSCEYTYTRGYPSLWNHPNETNLVVEAANKVIAPENVFEITPIMGGEDFSYYLKHVPGSFFYTCAGKEDMSANFPHHHPKFDIDERAMLVAAKTLAMVSLDYLNKSE